MDAFRFDRLARLLPERRTRRGLARFLAATPLLNGLVTLLAGDEATAAGRRMRRKKRHKHGRGRHNGRRKKKKTCRAESKARTCSGKCGIVRNKETCNKRVDCGPCPCDSTCQGGCCGDDGADPGLGPVEAEFLTLLNEYRIANGLPALAPNVQLAAAAEAHGLDMATRGYFSHTSPEGDGPSQRVANQGYSPGVWGESIAAGISTAEAVRSALQESADDNEIMLGIEFTEVGIGRTFKHDSAFGWYWTVDLARPASS